MIKLIITDMDGTLLNDKKEINSEFWEVFDKLTNDGVVFSIASGRPYYTLLEQFHEHQDKLLFICENGSYVNYKGKELFVNTIPREDSKNIAKEVAKVDGIIPLFCAKNKAYTPREVFENGPERAREEINKYYKKLELVDDILEVDDDFLKIAICDVNGAQTHSFPHFEHFRDRFQVAVSANDWVDFSNIGVNKGRAVAESQKNLGIEYDETMIFGDYLNDYEMMKEAHYSYAMKNAHEDLIKISNFITKYDNNENGVVRTIKEHF